MNSLSRRAILRSLAAGAAGAALLPITSRLTRAGVPTVARFLFVVEGNGYDPLVVRDPNTLARINASASTHVDGLRCWPQFYQHTSPIMVPSTDFAQTIALQQIAANQLTNQTAVVYGLSSVVTGGGHTANHGSLSSSRTVSNSPGGPTIDAYLAAQPSVRGKTPYDAVRVGTTKNSSGERLSYSTCATAAGVPAAVIVDPLSAYQAYFAVADPKQMGVFSQRTTLLSYATQDVQAALGAFGGSSDERRKLQTYLASLQELAAEQQQVAAMAPQLAKAMQTTNLKSPDQDMTSATDCMTRFEQQLNLAVTALVGQLTNVAVVTSGTGEDFENLTYPTVTESNYQNTGRHQLQHDAPPVGGDAAALSAIHQVNVRQFNAFANAAHVLAATQDPVGSGSMLDNTVMVFISDNGEQHHSQAQEFPVVLIGGKNLGLVTGGQTIVYPGLSAGNNHRQVSNLWNTLGYLAGLQLDTFGTEGASRIAPGPLHELMG